MYKIYINGKETITTEKVRYIKKHPTGYCYIPASELDAEGISVRDGVYALAGKELDGLEQAVVVECDGGEIVGYAEKSLGYEAGKSGELRAACREAIISGIDVETVHGTKHFSLKDDDQRNIDNLAGKAAMAQLGVLPGETVDYGLPYHADNEPCLLFSAADIKKIAAAKDAHILYHTTYHNQLKEYLKTLSAEEVKDAYYGMELPEPYSGNLSAIVGMFAGMA